MDFEDKCTNWCADLRGCFNALCAKAKNTMSELHKAGENIKGFYSALVEDEFPVSSANSQEEKSKSRYQHGHETGEILNDEAWTNGFWVDTSFLSIEEAVGGEPKIEDSTHKLMETRWDSGFGKVIQRLDEESFVLVDDQKTTPSKLSGVEKEKVIKEKNLDEDSSDSDWSIM